MLRSVAVPCTQNGLSLFESLKYLSIMRGQGSGEFRTIVFLIQWSRPKSRSIVLKSFVYCDVYFYALRFIIVWWFFCA